MDNRKVQLKSFFKQYSERFNQALKGEITDSEKTAACFSDCFIEASPAGVSCGKNDDSFRAAIPQGYSFYKSIGITSMETLAISTSILDQFHAMVKVHWKSYFIKKDLTGRSIEFDVIYFVQTKDDKHKIFAYITGDEQAALQENGLI
jgi:hypothetical protein